MSKGQKRGNREAKKPKQAKPKVAALAANSSTDHVKTGFLARAKKKW